MNYRHDDLAPEDYRAYRLARFGEAGRCGKEGVAKAAKQHGVAIRTWYTYEGGSRSPSESVKREVARWLNRTVRRDRAKPMAATVEVSLGRQTAIDLTTGREQSLDDGEARTTHTEVLST